MNNLHYLRFDGALPVRSIQTLPLYVVGISSVVGQFMFPSFVESSITSYAMVGGQSSMEQSTMSGSSIDDSSQSGIRTSLARVTDDVSECSCNLALSQSCSGNRSSLPRVDAHGNVSRTSSNLVLSKSGSAFSCGTSKHKEQCQSMAWPDLTASLYTLCEIPVWQVRCCHLRQVSHCRPSWRALTGIPQQIQLSFEDIVLQTRVETVGTFGSEMICVNHVSFYASARVTPLVTATCNCFTITMNESLLIVARN